MLLALCVGQMRGTVDDATVERIVRELKNMPLYIKDVLGLADKIKNLSKIYTYARNFLYLGRGYNYPTALEGALKLKEISYIHAEGYPAAEMKNINIQMIKFSLLGETILEWNDKDIEHYHARRMAMDSMLCRFKVTYPAERIDSVRSLLEDKERQMFQIVRLMDEQQSINKKIANQIPVIVQKSVQEQSKKPKRKGFLGIFGKKKEVTPAVSTTILHSVNRNVISEQKVQDRQLSEQASFLQPFT